MTDELEEKPCNFHEMELDDRILKVKTCKLSDLILMVIFNF